MNYFSILADDLYNIISENMDEKACSKLSVTNCDNYRRLWNRVGTYTCEYNLFKAEEECDPGPQTNDFVIPIKEECFEDCLGYDETEMCDVCYAKQHAIWDKEMKERNERWDIIYSLYDIN